MCPYTASVSMRYPGSPSSLSWLQPSLIPPKTCSWAGGEISSWLLLVTPCSFLPGLDCIWLEPWQSISLFPYFPQGLDLVPVPLIIGSYPTSTSTGLCERTVSEMLSADLCTLLLPEFYCRGAPCLRSGLLNIVASWHQTWGHHYSWSCPKFKYQPRTSVTQ